MSTCGDTASAPRIPMDAHQLDLLARTHAVRLASFLRRRVGNPEDVEDLVQETLMEAVRCSGEFQHQSRPETWLFGIALNLTRSYYKRAKVRATYTDHDADGDQVASDRAEDPLEIALHRERMVRVESAVKALPSDSHQLLTLVVFDDMSYEDVARKLGIPIGTVRSRVSRVRAFLKRHAEGGTTAARSQAGAHN